MRFITCFLCLLILSAIGLAAWVIGSVQDPMLRASMLVEYIVIELVFLALIALIARLLLR